MFIPILWVLFFLVPHNATAQYELVLSNVNLVSVDDQNIQPGKNIGLLDGKIACISDLPISSAGRRIDGNGKYVLPGFIDMHAHVVYMDYPIGRDPHGRMVLLPPTFDPETTKRTLEQMLEFGITTIRNPATPAKIGVRIRDDLRAGVIKGPVMYVAGNPINLDRTSRRISAPDEQVEVYVSNLDDLRKEVERQAACGIHFLKVYKSLPPEFIQAAILEARRFHLPVIGDLSATTWLAAANYEISALTHSFSWNPQDLPKGCRSHFNKARSTRSHMQSRIDWMECYDPESPAVTCQIASLVEHKVVVDPTLVANETKFKGDWEFYTNTPDLQYAPPKMLDAWKKGTFTSEFTKNDYERAHRVWWKFERFVYRMYKAGVHLTIGTDVPNPWVIPGASFHREMELFVQAGIPAAAVLKMATIDAARALGIDDREGTVSVGKNANLVVLSRNPYENIGHTRRLDWVIQQGKPVFSKEFRDK